MRHIAYCHRCEVKRKFVETSKLTDIKHGISGDAVYCEECDSALLLNEIPQVNHPQYYGGEDNPYEAIKVIEAWDLNFSLGNVVKYISRAGKKDPDKFIEDLEKAKQYIEFEIKRLKQ